jgi:hypothetical protein
LIAFSFGLTKTEHSTNAATTIRRARELWFMIALRQHFSIRQDERSRP